MASRGETKRRVEEMLTEMRRLATSGALAPGEMLPPMRELARRFDVSHNLASESLQQLVREGVLYTVPRLGVFVGRPNGSGTLQNAEGASFLLLLPPNWRKYERTSWEQSAIRAGFETSIARLGGTSLTIESAAALAMWETGRLPPLAGVCEVCGLGEPNRWPGPEPVVELREMLEPNPRNNWPNDVVYVDNEDGGYVASRHLLQMGHRRVAFLALHGEKGEAGILDWSRQREVGWRRALKQFGVVSNDLAFHPECTPINSREGLYGAAQFVAQNLMKCGFSNSSEAPSEGSEPISAVVAVNAAAAHELLAALEAAQVVDAQWPAIVSFDDFSPTDRHLLSALSPSWEELGQQSAQTLWERATHASLLKQQKPVAMRLIPRLSCRAGSSPVRNLLGASL